MTERIFITSSGTDIGKTFVTCAMIHQLHAAGRSVAALKPVLSGFDEKAPEASDAGLIAKALGTTDISQIAPWRFKAPLSPHMAAAKEGVTLSMHDIAGFCMMRREEEFTLIEGVGGVMVPLYDECTVLDWIEVIDCKTVLVVGSYLGSISHSLTAYTCLKARHVNVACIIVSETKGSEVSLDATTDTLRNFTEGSVPIVTLPRQRANVNMDAIPNLTGWMDGRG